MFQTTIKENWKRLLFGDPSKTDLSDESTLKMLSVLDEVAMRNLALLQENGKTHGVALFRSTPIQETAEMTEEYRKLRSIALAYGTYGCKFYQDERVKEDILWSIEWGYNHYYGHKEGVDAPNAWRSPGLFNWWDWWIGTPDCLFDILLAVDNYLSVEDMRRYIFCYENTIKAPYDFGANKVNHGRLILCSGALMEKADRILTACEGIKDTYLYADDGTNSGQGFYKDGSYIFHTAHPQTGTYGLHHFSSVLQFTAYIKNTEYEMSKEYTDIISAWQKDNFAPFYQSGEFMSAVLGRAPQRSVGTGFEYLKSLVLLYGIADGERKREVGETLLSCVKQNPAFVDFVSKDFFEKLSVYEYNLYREAIRENTPQRAEEKLYCFNRMDRVVQKTDEYAFALALSSSRIYNYESINFENMQGFYLSDGMLYSYDKPLVFGKDYFEKVNYYRLPGVTADTQQRQAVSIAQKNEYLSSQDFVGGLSTGRTGVACMSLESYHSDGELISNQHYHPSGCYGGPPPKHDCSLTAKKSYFFLDGVCVCLGADINARDGFEVCTTLENRRASVVKADGKQVKNTGEVRAKIVELDSQTLYFTKPENVFFNKTENGFWEVWLSHGVNPNKGEYAYAVAPTGKRKNFIIVENNEKSQIIQDGKDIYACLWEKGSYGDLSVDTPCLVSIKENTLFVYDPTQKQEQITVHLSGKEYIFHMKKGETVSVKL